VRPLLLAHTWDPAKLDPTGWWISPKLDGIRAYWDGDATLWSRQGNAFAKAPPEYLALLPQGVPLDGELYLGPGRFNDTVRAVKGAAGWADLRYVVFDAPPDPGTYCAGSLDAQDAAAVRGFGYSYEERMAFATDAWHDVVPLVRCEGVSHVWAALADAELQGLEGVMLRQPGSLYEGKRSRTLLKVKTFHDLEVTVIDHIPGKGKHKGRLGALACGLDGFPACLVDVGTGFSDAQREAPPAIGSRITIKFQEYTPAGVPRFPVFVSERNYE
jgi:DNA ligase-1